MMFDPLAWLRERFSPGLMNAGEIQTSWSSREERAVRRLGTCAEARTMITELEKAGECTPDLKAILERHFVIRELRDDDPLGDPDDVHHVIPPCNRIGYALEECDDGYALATIETLHVRWALLLRRGKLIGASFQPVLRMESYGPIHVV